MVLASKLPLPDECIDLILAYLVDHRQALHALILASQKLFQRTAPILYRSPFHLIENSPRWSREEKEKRATQLLALLLTSKATTATHSAIATTPVIHPGATTTSLIVTKELQPQQQPYPATLDYLRFYILQYHVDLWRPLVNLRAMASEMNHYILHDSKSMTDVQNDVAMALVEYRPEDIKVIGQPIARAPMVLVPHIERLCNLVRLELCEIPYGCKVEPVLEFIRVHDAIHHTLREIKIKGSEDLNRHLEPTHSQLVRLVQAMRTPHVVDARHWREAILVIDQLPHECLKTLLLGMADMPPSYIPVSDYLEQCVLLEELRMPVRDERLFAWASAARNAMGLDRNGAEALSKSVVSPGVIQTVMSSAKTNTLFHSSTLASISASSLTSLSSVSTPSPWQLRHHYHPEWHEFEEKHGLAQIRSLELCGEDRCLIPALRDAIDAFRDSLETLKAQSLAIMMTTVPVLNSMTLTWSWPLARLTVLDLEGEVASAFDFSALRFCPRLTTLRLCLPPYMYSTTEDEHMLVEMTSKMSQICLATGLLDLELQGKWPLSDELLGMMTRQMRKLTRLYIVSCSGYSMEGVQMLIRGLERLETLSISRWLCAWQPMRTRMQAMKSLNSRLEVVEE